MADEEVWHDFGDDVFQDILTDVWEDLVVAVAITGENNSQKGLLLHVY